MSHVFPRAIGRDLPVVARARGALIYDDRGKRYIDGAGGALVVGIGHGDGAVVDALEAQARRVAYAHATQFRSGSLESYAGQVAELLPLQAARIYPVSGGSEATETALKMARAYHLARGDDGRHKVIARSISYHGNTLNALDASGRWSLREPYRPWLGRTLHVTAPDMYRHQHSTDAAYARHLADELDRAIRAEGPETVACFLAEPIVGAAQAAMSPPEGYWPAIAEVCARHGVLVIADEVMTGFGRTGAWFAAEHFGLRPDILIAGKGVASGYWPLGFAACSGKIYTQIARTGFAHGFTFSHSGVGAAVAAAVLWRLKEEELVAASRAKGERLRSMLQDALGAHDHVGDIRGRGLMVGIEMVADRASKTSFDREALVTEKVTARALELGLIVYPAAGCGGSDGDAVMLGPPFVITENEMNEAVDLLRRAIDEVCRERPARIP